MISDVRTITALQGKNVGLVVGEIQTGIALDGTGTKVSIPDDYLGNDNVIFPKRCVSFTPTPDDIIVYNQNGTIVDVTAIDNDTGELTLDESVTSATADFVEEFEPYIATNVKVDVKQDKNSYDVLRTDIKHTSYSAKELTISQDNLVGDLDPLIKMCGEPYSGDEDVGDDVEVFQLVSDPKIMYAYIPLEVNRVIVGRLCFPQIRGTLTSLLDVKAGDNAQYALEMAVDSDPLILRPKV